MAVEPDDRMRRVLEKSVPGVRAVPGRGEAMPLPDRSADAVVAASSWHWMDPLPTLTEVGRVLVPGGTLGALWSGPDPDGPFFERARSLLAAGGDGAELGRAVENPHRPEQVLSIPPGVPFDQPETTTIRWEVALDADALVGLLGTYSWVILMDDTSRTRLFETARRVLRDDLGVEDAMTVERPVPDRPVEGPPPGMSSGRRGGRTPEVLAQRACRPHTGAPRDARDERTHGVLACAAQPHARAV